MLLIMHYHGNLKDYLVKVIKNYNKNCLFGAATLTKNTDIDKNRYSGYGIGFHRGSSFLFPDGSFGQNIIIFGPDMNSSPRIDNKKKEIIILGKGPTQGLGEH